MRRTVIFLMGMMTAVLFAVPVSAALYKYVDSRGIVRYADNLEAVPERYRSQVAPPAPAVLEAPAVKPPAVTPPAVEAPAKIVAAPKTGPSIEEAAIEPEVVTPEPAQPSVAITEPEPPVTKKVVIAPAPVKPVAETIAPEPRVVSSDTKAVPKKEPSVEIIAAPIPANALPETEPHVAETVKEAVVTPAPVETAYQVPEQRPDHPVDADIAQLLEERKTLLEKKEALDNTFLSLAAERKAIEASRAGLRDEKSIRQYNENALRLNERIQRFKREETALRDKIEGYNALITKKQ